MTPCITSNFDINKNILLQEFVILQTKCINICSKLRVIFFHSFIFQFYFAIKFLHKLLLTK